MRRPIIAITADQMLEPSAAFNQNKASFAAQDLKEGILAAGGLPIILPFPDQVAQAEEIAQAHVALFDGLVIPGGPDIDPSFYGEGPIFELGQTNYKRDAYEIALVKEAVKAGKAIFGICRGLQLINVALGGSLYQDLAKQNPQSSLKHAQATYASYPTHDVKIQTGSHLQTLLGETSYVNSRHHQALRVVASELTVTARAADDVVEAVESTDQKILAVQWHPENMWQEFPEQLTLFTDLIKRSQ